MRTYKNTDPKYRLLELFSEKIKSPTTFNDCWEWVGTRDKDGYGKLKYNHKQYRANRVSYEIFNNKNPGNMLVCHRCDNPPCVNPEHLFLGSPKDNMEDASRKGRLINSKERKNARSRLYTGKRNPFYGKHHSKATINKIVLKNGKLNEKDIRNIKKMLNDGMAGRIIAKCYGIHESAISMIKHGKIYKYLGNSK